MLFKDLDIIAPIQKALEEAGYTSPTPIQEQSIPHSLEGRDILGCAQTGTGKTASFAIPVLQNLHKEQKNTKKDIRPIKALILAPTRELAIQIEESFTAYGKHMDLKNLVIFGGVNQNPQTRALTRGVDILIATPGRLLDLMNQKFVDLSKVTNFVLDEADRMLDMGMINDVKKIIAKLPKEKQTMFFSATMPNEVTKLVDSLLKNPVKVEVTPVSSTVDRITQGLYMVEKKQKKLLLAHILKDESIKSVLVFSRTKHGANKITTDLEKVGVAAQAIHGNKSQNARQLALNNFKEGKIRVLVATDIAARGIDVDELSHVINYDLPETPETYVHRIGRTGRAGNDGVALSFCSWEERDYLRYIQKLIKKDVPLMEENPYPLSATQEPSAEEKQQHQQRKPAGRRQGSSNKPAGNKTRNNGYNGRRKQQNKKTTQV
ncbi:MAG: DEAD/DEAH box helicase [Clostridium sp.]